MLESRAADNRREVSEDMAPEDQEAHLQVVGQDHLVEIQVVRVRRQEVATMAEAMVDRLGDRQGRDLVEAVEILMEIPLGDGRVMDGRVATRDGDVDQEDRPEIRLAEVIRPEETRPEAILRDDSVGRIRTAVRSSEL